jgi:putative FmdB family regulatory protein
MPTYDYECEACGHTFEKWQEMSAKKLRTCPVCRKPRLVRLVGGGAGVIFRGSGFYETDYKRKGGSGGGTEKAASGGTGGAKGAGDEGGNGGPKTAPKDSGGGSSCGDA